MNATRRQLYDDPRRNERDYPHIVEMPIPENGLGSRLDDMHDWHRSRFLESRRGHGRWSEGSDYIRWCFKDAKDAEDFRAAFGGYLIASKYLFRGASRA